jgi:hypothetical protein
MQRFTFQLVNRDLAILDERVQQLPDERAIWDHIAELAAVDAEPGSRIRVLNESGGIVASLGLASAHRILEEAA